MGMKWRSKTLSKANFWYNIGMKKTLCSVYVIDEVAHLGDYAAINPGFAKVAAFLARPDLGSLASGRYELDGGKVVAIVNGAAELVSPSERRPEIHREFFDVQVPLSGEETYGLARFDPSAHGSFDEANDIGFYDQPVELHTLRPGEFAILHPETCAHAPACSLSGPRAIRKIVFKVHK